MKRKPLLAGLAAASLLLLASTSCSNPVAQPNAALISHSDYLAAYPYEVVVELTQTIRSDIHTFDLGDTKVRKKLFLLLKTNTGTLTTGDFAVGTLGTRYPMPSRGTIVIQGSDLSIDVEVGAPNYKEGDNSILWSRSEVNGNYQLVGN